MAVAEASLSTVMFWISLGLSSVNGLRGSEGAPPRPIPPASVDSLLMGTPSMTYSGSLLALMEVPPRMRTWAPAPGSPPSSVTFTPATRPASMPFTFGMTPTLASAPLTVTTEPVIASRRCVPYPTVTTSERNAATGLRETLSVAVPPADTGTCCCTAA